MALCAEAGLVAAGAGAAAITATNDISVDQMLPINNQYHYEAADIKILLDIILKNEAGIKILEPVCLFDQDQLSREIMLYRAENIAERIIIACSAADYQWLGLSLQFNADNTLIVHLINPSGVPLSEVITLKLNEQLVRVAKDIKYDEVRGLFREDAVSSGPCLVEYFKSLCKIGLPIDAHDINIIRKQQQTLLYNNTQTRELNKAKRISNAEIFNEFNFRQYHNLPSLERKIFFPSATSADYFSVKNHGIELVNDLLDFEFIEVIDAILNIDIHLSPTQFFLQLLEVILANPDYVKKNENILKILAEDSVRGLSAEAVKSLILAKFNYAKQTQVHAFFRFYHEIFQIEPTINVVAAGTEFLLNLSESAISCAKLVRLFASFAYYRNRKGATALQMALERNDRLLVPILLEHAPLVESNHLAESISLADHCVMAAISPEIQWSWTIFFANRLVGIDVHQALLETKYADAASLNLLQVYRKQLLWLQNPATFNKDADKKYESMDAAKYFAIKFTLLLRLLLEVEQGRVELPALPAAAGAGVAVPSMEEHRTLIVKSLLVELNRELKLVRVVFYAINYLKDPIKNKDEVEDQDENYFNELRSLLSVVIIQNLTKLNVDNSLIIPLYWMVSEFAVSCCGANPINSGHALYLQITAREDAYYLYLHNYGDENILHLQSGGNFYPYPLRKIVKEDLDYDNESRLNDRYVWLRKFLTNGLAFKEKGNLIGEYYPGFNDAMPQLRSHSPQNFGNCIAYGHYQAQVAVTEGLGPAWSSWLLQQQLRLLNDLEMHIAAASSTDIVESSREILPKKNKFNPTCTANILKPFAFPSIAVPISSAPAAAPRVARIFGGNVNNATEVENNYKIN